MSQNKKKRKPYNGWFWQCNPHVDGGLMLLVWVELGAWLNVYTQPQLFTRHITEAELWGKPEAHVVKREALVLRREMEEWLCE